MLPTTQRLVSIIVPVYVCDSSLFPTIQRSYDSILALDGDIETVFVDDASPLAHYFPITVTNTVNLGFTATVNKGLQTATGNVLIVMNDDIEITQECFNRFSQLKGLQIASPRDTASSPDDRFGSCWAMTREVYELLGPLNEKYRNFYSDRDYYDRAKKAGIEMIKWQDIVLEHSESSTFKTLDKEKLLAEDATVYQGVLDSKDVNSTNTQTGSGRPTRSQ